MVTDGSTTEDGWFIDALSVTDQGAQLAWLPVQENFETNLTNWLAAGWLRDTNQAYEGEWSSRAGAGRKLSPDTQYWMEYGRELSLTNLANPQLTFWLRGQLVNYSRFRVQVSKDGGLNWAELPEVNGENGMDIGWTRKQASLQSYAGQTIRIRFNAYSYNGYVPDSDISVDKITLDEMPAAVTLETLTPHLRSVDVTWSATTLGAAFQRYEVYQATHANVTPADTLVGSFTNPAELATTDTGLTIGSTYYYRVFAVDTNDTYIPSNERSTTTVPVTLPLTDDFTTADQWVTTGAWGVTVNGGLNDGPGLADSPTGDYDNSTDSYALTAVNLVGTTWPVLRFSDRHRLAGNDWARLEVSPNGTTWYPIYGVMGVRTNWNEASVDLSPWKNQANLRLRFRMVTDGSTTEDGWFIDALSVTDQGAQLAWLPVQENFETNLTNWLAAGWLRDTNQAYEGEWSSRAGAGRKLSPDTQYWMEYGRELSLTNLVNPQLTFWLRGQLVNYSRFRVQVSKDGGLNWAELPEVNGENGMDIGWTRKQASLQSYAGQTIRIRFNAYSYNGYIPDSDISVDKITLDESPAGVTVQPIDQVTVSSLHLSWTAATISNFKEYRVYRSDTPTVSDSSTLLAVITNPAELEFVDTGLTARKTYYYRIYLYDTNDTGVGSNQSSATTLGVPMGWADGFETNQPCWTYTGTWTPQIHAGRNGSIGLVDSPGDYANSSDTYAQVAVDLSETTWPVLKFWDHHALAESGDYGRVMVSGNAGSSWTSVYGVSGVRTNWMEQSIDLSPWKGQSQVWIQFRLGTDGNTQNDGWYVDDVSISENPTGQAGYPFMANFESGQLTNWLTSGWTLSSDAAHDGEGGVHAPAASRIAPDTSLWLVLGRELPLTNAIDPQLSFWLRGQLVNYSRFRVQISTDGGVSWTDLSALNQDNGFSSDWAHRQISLQAYTNHTVRLRFNVYSYNGYAPASEIAIDQAGIGEPAPGAPSLVAPAQFDSVTEVRPMLKAGNAIDFQSDPLTYRFEVYADAGLGSLVAQVPAVAAGLDATAWQVDVDLPNNSQFWWRCQASDGTNSGPWMATASFFVNQTNHPPGTPVVAGPPNGATLTNLSELLLWFPVEDADVGDSVARYQLQVDSDPAFANPVINETSLPASAWPGGLYWIMGLPLESFGGATNLVVGTTYNWRIRAQDSHGMNSDWSTGAHTFQFGTSSVVVPEPATFTGLRFGSSGSLILEWSAATGQIYVEHSPGLNPADWQTVAGPVTGTNWTFTPAPGESAGFFRLRSQ